MRARFAKRRRKEALRKGLYDLEEGRVWSGYYVEGTYEGCRILAAGIDKLRAYQLMLSDMKWMDENETHES